MKSFLIMILVSLLHSCSSLNDKTIAKMDDEPRPKWANHLKAIQLKDGKMQILGFNELDVTARISAAFRLSDNSARSELSKLIQTQFSSILQSLEEGVEDNGNLTRNYSSEVSKNLLRELQITQRYWEKVQTFNQDGETAYKLRVYSLAEIPEAKFKKLLQESISEGKIPGEIKKQIMDQFEGEIKKFQTL